MTGFRNFVMSCALAAASMIPPVAPVQAMPRPALDIEIKAPADVQSVRHRGWGGGYYGGWGRGYYPGWGHGYRRAGISFYFGPGLGYYPGSYYSGYYPRNYYGNRYYYGNRFYGPGYYPYRYYRPNYYGYRSYRPYYGGYNGGYNGGYVRQGYGSHVTWCLSRYRSYNPATNRFLSYGGVYRVCYSPYR